MNNHGLSVVGNEHSAISVLYQAAVYRGIVGDEVGAVVVVTRVKERTYRGGSLTVGKTVGL